MVSFQVNGKSASFDGDCGTPLLWVLRDHLQLRGSKYGCGIGQCGACSVHINGTVQRSCITPVSTVAGSSLRIFRLRRWSRQTLVTIRYSQV